MSSRCRHGLPTAQCSLCLSEGSAGGDPGGARELLSSLAGQTIHTLTGRPNRILRFVGDDVIVATNRSPGGSPVPISWVQEALERLYSVGDVQISVESVGYRSAFIGAVLSQVPGATASNGRVILTGNRRSEGKLPSSEG